MASLSKNIVTPQNVLKRTVGPGKFQMAKSSCSEQLLFFVCADFYPVGCIRKRGAGSAADPRIHGLCGPGT
jgi:hypothetical protein